MSSSLLFVIIIFLLLLKLKVGNKITEFLGKMSLELYLIQGLFITLFRSDKIMIENNYLYIIYTLIGTIITAYILNLIDKFILKKYKKMI
jgi:peptidoglycan/LPS O-acetylase OafA/YrhL